MRFDWLNKRVNALRTNVHGGNLLGVNASIHVHVGTRDTVACEIVHQIVPIAHAAVLERGAFGLAIPGGSVAEAILPVLASASLPWSQVHVFWVDERVVPTSSPDSNRGRALALIDGTPMATDAVLHGMASVDGVADDAADRVADHIADDVGDGVVPAYASASLSAYAETLHTFAGTPPVLDVVLLGVGDDGHVASLFPGHATLQETELSVVCELESPKPPLHRWSLTLPVLSRARCVIVAAFGTTKAAVLRDALENPDAATPLALVLQRASQVVVMLDRDAAALLTQTPQVYLV